MWRLRNVRNCFRGRQQRQESPLKLRLLNINSGSKYFGWRAAAGGTPFELRPDASMQPLQRQKCQYPCPLLCALGRSSQFGADCGRPFATRRDAKRQPTSTNKAFFEFSQGVNHNGLDAFMTRPCTDTKSCISDPSTSPFISAAVSCQ